jgi:hypothetical protein
MIQDNGLFHRRLGWAVLSLMIAVTAALLPTLARANAACQSIGCKSGCGSYCDCVGDPNTGYCTVR